MLVNKPYIIAEISANHSGSFDKAVEMIKEASKAGVSAVKFQCFKPESMTLNSDKSQFIINKPDSPWFGKKLYDLYQEAYTPWEWFPSLFRVAKENNIECFSSVFDNESVDYLESLDCSRYKISSFENNHTPLIDKVISTNKPYIISLGMMSGYAMEAYIKDVLKKDKKAKDRFSYLLCESSYPAAYNIYTLNNLSKLTKKFKQLKSGLSDHTLGIWFSLSAISHGASIIEKHFKLDDNCVDASFSIDKYQLKELVDQSNLIVNKPNVYQYYEFCRSIYAKKDIKCGDVIDENNTAIIRGANGIEPKYYQRIIGTVAKKNIDFADPITKQCLSLDIV